MVLGFGADSERVDCIMSDRDEFEELGTPCSASHFV
jgi:hypothetical protein